MIPKILKPIYVCNLVRLGWKLDGGYVIPKKIINKIKFCISFGLGDNFSFEKDLQKLNPTLKIYAYDPFVNLKFWSKHFFFWLWHSLRYRKFLEFRYLHFLDYYFFFLKENNNHFKKKITKDYSINEVIKKNLIKKKETLLKIDIDGDEYKIIENQKLNDFLCVIIEFENCDKNLNKILKFISNNQKLSVAHIHANNYSFVGRKMIPKTLEITFIQSYLFNKKRKNLRNYPIKNLDYPNNIMKKDIILKFK